MNRRPVAGMAGAASARVDRAGRGGMVMRFEMQGDLALSFMLPDRAPDHCNALLAGFLEVEGWLGGRPVTLDLLMFSATGGGGLRVEQAGELLMSAAGAPLFFGDTGSPRWLAGRHVLQRVDDDVAGDGVALITAVPRGARPDAQPDIWSLRAR